MELQIYNEHIQRDGLTLFRGPFGGDSISFYTSPSYI